MELVVGSRSLRGFQAVSKLPATNYRIYGFQAPSNLLIISNSPR